jgi:tetratricopeptide (TPR) repeat protein
MSPVHSDMGNKRLILVGLDSVGSGYFSSLLDSGYTPNLNRLVERGVLGELRSFGPPGLIPRWMSIVTGILPARHGILSNATVPTGVPNDTMSVTVRRSAKTIWEQLHRSGLSSIIVGCPGFPDAEPIQGVMIGNSIERVRIATESDVEQERVTKLSNLAEPPFLLDSAISTYRQEAERLRLEYSERSDPTGFDAMESIPVRLAFLESIVSARTRISLLMDSMHREKDWRFAMIYFPGSNRICAQSMVSQKASESEAANSRSQRMKDIDLALGLYMREVDRLIGQLQQSAPGAIYAICSNPQSASFHGVLQDNQLGFDFRPPKEETKGVVIFSGDDLPQDQLVFNASIEDVTPTIFHCLGVHAFSDSDGRSIFHHLGSSAQKIPAVEAAHAEVGNRDKKVVCDVFQAELDRIVEGFRGLPFSLEAEDIKRRRRFELVRRSSELADWLRISGFSAEAAIFLERVFDQVPDSFLIGCRLLRFKLAGVLSKSVSLEDIAPMREKVAIAFAKLPESSRSGGLGDEMHSILSIIDEIENQTTRKQFNSSCELDVSGYSDLTRLRVTAEQALEAGDIKTAVKALQELSVHPRSTAWPLIQLAMLYIRSGKMDDALGYAEQAIAKNYGVANAHYIKGYVHFVRQQLFEACESLRVAIFLNPEHQNAERLLEHIRNLTGI